MSENESSAPVEQGGTPATEPAEVDWQAKAQHWQEMARKNEARAKENADAAKQLEELRQASLSETERAVADAEKRGRQAALGEYGTRLAAAEIRAALSGIVSDPAALIDDLNLAKFVTPDGDVDTKAVTALADKYAALAPKPVTDLKQGTRPSADPVFDPNAWLRSAAGIHS